MALTAVFFYLFADRWRCASARPGHRREEPRALGAVPDPRLLQRGRAVRAARRRVPGDAAGRRLRRRGGGAVPVRRDDAGRRFRRAARRASSSTCRSARWSAASCWSRWCWWSSASGVGAGVPRSRSRRRSAPQDVTNAEAIGAGALHATTSTSSRRPAWCCWSP